MRAKVLRQCDPKVEVCHIIFGEFFDDIQRVKLLEVRHCTIGALAMVGKTDGGYDGMSNHAEEAEMTIDTPLPVSVDPPPNLGAPPVATLVDSDLNEPAIANGNLPISMTCTVIAPITLEAGYTFLATIDGIDFPVTVPDGGVSAGQDFQVPYPQAESVEVPVSVVPLEIAGPSYSGAPRGYWRDDIWSCFQVSSTGIFWQGCCCTLILLGQVMTRNGLNMLGLPSDAYEKTFKRILVLWFGLLATFMILIALNYSGLLVAIDAGSPILAFLILTTVLIANTRYEVRQRYGIPVKCCNGCHGRCDDLCCGLWCPCCVTIQMARHTHPHTDRQYVCCSTTGLEVEDASATV